MNSKRTLLKWIGGAAGILLLLAVLVWAGQRLSNPFWEQETMGTLCHITISGPMTKSELKRLRVGIDAALEQIDSSMSTWNPNSEISRFNGFQGSQPYVVQPDFAAVVRRALAIAEMTGGAFDPTVKPLVDHWGFGAEADSAPLAELMQAVGWRKLRATRGALIKNHPDVQLDLSAIAKGYGADAVADVIYQGGHTNFLVEIGGEIVAFGTNPKGNPWRVGVEAPEPAAGFGDRILQTIELSGQAMATSGGYRNFRVREDGTRYSHIIDPRTGLPAESDVASVSVISPSCMDADAAATALFVLGSEKGIELVEDLSNVEALFVLHSTNGTFAVRTTSGFPE